jgi:hypothetical protein
MQIQAYLAAAAVNLKRLAAALAAAILTLLMERVLGQTKNSRSQFAMSTQQTA